MMTDFFESRFRILQLRGSQDGRLLDVFIQELLQTGFARITARRHIRAAEHLLYWARRKGLSPATFDDHTIDEFARHLLRCRCKGYGHRQRRDLQQGARLFVGSLRRAELLPMPSVQQSVEDPPVLLQFRDWMRQHRGICDATLYNYGRHLRALLRTVGSDPGKFEARSLRQFIQETSQGCGWATGKQCTTAVRTFLRYLIADGKCAAGLDACVPALAHWRLSSLPRYLQPDEVERVIASCSTSSAGIRDRAILLLLARVGLRAGDILRLRLSDLDWQEATIRVVGKGRRQTLLPMTQEVGDAIVAYIKNGRHLIDNDTLFIRSRAPFRAFASHCAISVLVAQAMRRAGVRCPSRGAAHVLRHSIASSMLRQGASLQEIAGVLRHRSIATTEIYAKVDVVALREIAQPWPEVTSC